MRSVEIKHELRDPELAVVCLRKLRAINVGATFQIDTCFRLSEGRLIKRDVVGEPPEWIAYDRQNAPYARECSFTIFSEREAHDRYGARELPTWTIVRKRRELWIAGAVRVHLDMVDRLGWFIEFETLVSKKQDAAKCRALIEAVRDEMRLALGEAVGASYSDLAAEALTA